MLKELYQTTNLRQHRETDHVQETNYSCNFPRCSKPYRLKQDLVQHELIVHEERRYLCHVPDAQNPSSRRRTSASIDRRFTNVSHFIANSNTFLCLHNGCNRPL